jgi:cytochrome c oxidase subunit 5a
MKNLINDGKHILNEKISMVYAIETLSISSFFYFLGWDIRQGINHMNRLDLIPEPEIISACLQACRRVNDHSLAVRYLEAIRYKSNAVSNQVWPWILQEIRPTLDKLGISTPEDLGYDKPELALKSVDDL